MAGDKPEEPRADEPTYGQPDYGQPGYPQPGYSQPGYSQPGYPQAGYGQPGYPPAPAYYAPAPDHPRATTAMVLGIIALVGGLACYLPLFAAPFAWVIGMRARREIDAQPGLGGRSSATAGMVMGIIGTVILALGIALLVLVIVLGVTGAFDDSSSSGSSNASAAWASVR